MLEIDVLGYETDDFGWTAIWPGSGFLGDLFTDPSWRAGSWTGERARSRGRARRGRARRRVRRGDRRGPLARSSSRARARARRSSPARGGSFELPSAEGAAPPAAADGLRTYPPRENGGNIDVRDLVVGQPALPAGARARRAAVDRRPALRPGRRRGVHLRDRDRRLARPCGWACAGRAGGRASPPGRPRRGPGRTYFATTGIPLDDDGRNEHLDLNLATRRALIEMLDWLEHEHGLEREPAYVLMSAAVELRVSELVDAPNALVSAALPLDVFED